MGDELIYLLQAGPFYKIGRTTDVPKRVQNIQTSQPYEVKVLRTWSVIDGVAIEAYLRHKFQSVRMQGEWFQLSSIDVEWLEGIHQWDLLSMLPKQTGLSLREVLQRHDIHSIKMLSVKAGLSRQHAWLLWWGETGVGKVTMARLHERLHIPLKELMRIDPVSPPQPRGRPRHDRED